MTTLFSSRILSTLVDRVTFETDLSYACLKTAFESQLGRYDHDTGQGLVQRNAAWNETTAVIGTMVGPHGLMVMFQMELGTTASLNGVLRQCMLYLVGNPLIATEIVDLDLRGAMLVPFRVEIYADGQKSFLSYDTPSSSLGSLGNPEIDRIAEALDDKMAVLVAALTLQKPD